MVLYYVLPELFYYWRWDGGAFSSLFVGGFGFVSGSMLGVHFGPEYAEDIFLLLTGVLIIGGSSLLFIGALVESKALGIIGGLVFLSGPILHMVALFLGLGIFEGLVATMPSGTTILFGSDVGVNWGIWICTYMAIGGGVLGVIGGATL